MSSIFQNFWLPNATTWFYFSLVLAVALFFKFSRLLSMRNWDVLTIFLLVPGILMIEDAHPTTSQKQLAAATLVGDISSAVVAAPTSGLAGLAAVDQTAQLVPKSWLKLGYIWLLVGSGYLLLRCLMDLALVQRPALSPNLNLSGLAWLGSILLVCLAAVAFRTDDGRQPTDLVHQLHGPINSESEKVGRQGAALDIGQRSLEGWAQRATAVVCHLVVCLGLIVVCRVHFQDGLSGWAAATFYLLLPYTGHYVQLLTHVWPMTLIIWALVAYRRPVISGILMGLAAGTIYLPLLLFPLWFSFYRGRGAGRFSMAFVTSAALALAVTGWILLSTDDLGRSIKEAIDSSDWQPWRVPMAEGIWQGIHWAYRIPVFVGFLAFVALTAFWPTPKNLGHLIALSAAILIGVQFWYADKGGQYVLWYLPLLLLLIFRPNLSERRPLPIVAENDWVTRFAGRITRSAGMFFRAPESLTRTP